MGWKSVKDYYKIEHIVQVRDGNILIGSSYIPDIIIISPDGTIKKRHERHNEDLSRIQAQMDADPATLRELINAIDCFSDSITIYTYSGADILEKQCEVLGWPNVTHDGCLMYENTFFRDKAEAIKKAKSEAALGIKFYRRDIRKKEKEIKDMNAMIEQEKGNLKKLMQIA